MVVVEEFEDVLIDAIETKNEHQFKYILNVLKVNPEQKQKCLNDLSIFEKVLKTPGTRKFIKMCITNGCKLNQKNWQEIYPLQYAIESQDAENLKTFLESFDPPHKNDASDAAAINKAFEYSSPNLYPGVETKILIDEEEKKHKPVADSLQISKIEVIRRSMMRSKNAEQVTPVCGSEYFDDVFKSQIINERFDCGNNYLHKLIDQLTKGNYSELSNMIKLMLNHKCSANMPNDQLETPFYLLLKKFPGLNVSSDLVEFFLDNAPVDFFSYHSSEIIKFMEENDLHERIISKRKNLKLMSDLLEEFNEKKFVADFAEFHATQRYDIGFGNDLGKFLEAAVARNFKDAVKLLLDHGADVNGIPEGSKFNILPSFIACSFGHHDVLKILLGQPSARFQSGQQSVLQQICLPSKIHLKDRQKCFDRIIADPRCTFEIINTADDQGFVPLFYACQHRFDRIAKELLRRGSFIGHKSVIDNINKNVLQEFLDECIKSPNDIEDINCKIHIDYRFLTPTGVLDKEHQEVRSIHAIAKNQKLKKLIVHPVISSFSHIKWKKINWLVHFNLLAYFIFMIFLGVFIIAYFQDHPAANMANIATTTTIKPVTKKVAKSSFGFFGLPPPPPLRTSTSLPPVNISNTDYDKQVTQEETGSFYFGRPSSTGRPRKRKTRTTTTAVPESSYQSPSSYFISNSDNNSTEIMPIPDQDLGKEPFSEIKKISRRSPPDNRSNEYNPTITLREAFLGLEQNISASDNRNRSTESVSNPVRVSKSGSSSEPTSDNKPTENMSNLVRVSESDSWSGSHSDNKSDKAKNESDKAFSMPHPVNESSLVTEPSIEDEYYDEYEDEEVETTTEIESTTAAPRPNPSQLLKTLFGFGRRKRDTQSVELSETQKSALMAKQVDSDTLDAHQKYLLDHKYSYLFCIVGVFLMVVYELAQFSMSFKDYFFKVSNWLDIALVSLSVLVLIFNSYILHEDFKKIRAATVLVMAAQSIQLVSKVSFLSMSLHMAIFKKVCKTFLKTVALYMILILAFAMSFYTLYDQKQKDKAVQATKSDENATLHDTGEKDSTNGFSGAFISIISIVRMMLSDFGSVDIKPNDNFQGFMFLLFMVLISVVLLNLLNALAISDTNQIMLEAEFVNTMKRISNLYAYEKIFATLKLSFASIFPKYSLISLTPNLNNEITFESIDDGSNSTTKIESVICKIDAAITFFQSKSSKAAVGDKVLKNIVNFVKRSEP